jgi:lysozyme family protein
MNETNKTAFDRALARLLEIEGGYVNDPDDPGGETCWGISRRFHPDWQGWAMVDAVKAEYGTGPAFSGINDITKALVRGALDRDENLQALVATFYRTEFWNRFRGDAIPVEIADEMLDIAVNLGVHQAVKFLQSALNLWPFEGEPLVVDGIFGWVTEERVNALDKSEIRSTVTMLNILQGMHYMELVKERPDKAKYLKGWLKRITLEKR